jgi:uncharacterized protein YjbI with pentapeptide repeats
MDLPDVLRLHALWLRGGQDGCRANLRGANLRGANLSYANLTCANLTCANLTCANLADANLTCANLADANLTCANLADANLSYANLADASLNDADLTGANLSYANLSRASLSRASLTDADLTGANLTGANLAGANLAGANLAGANLRGADLTDANLACAIGLHIASDAPTRLLAVARAALASDNALEMCRWHTCDSTHCISGWAEHLGGPIATLLYQQMGPSAAGLMLLGVMAHSYFYASNEKARAFLQSVVDNAEAA